MCNLSQRNIASNRRVASSSHPSQPPEPSPSAVPSAQPASGDQPTMFSLPMYGTELGRLPVYGQFIFSDSLRSTAGTVPAPRDYTQPPPLSVTLSSTSNNAQGLSSNPVWGTFPDPYNFYGSNNPSPETNSTNTPDSNSSHATSSSTGFSSVPSNLNSDFDLDAFLQACGVNSVTTINTSYNSNPSGSTNLNGSSTVQANIPNIDDDSLAVWSTAPANLE